VEDWNDATFARSWAENQTMRPHSPLREEQVGLLLDILRAHCAAAALPTRVLDLGCGPGIVAARILDAVPGTVVVGVDGSAPMLELARGRLAPYAGRFELAQADFETLTTGDLAGGPFAAAIAVQAIHNCSDEGKRRTLAAVRTALAPGGLFVLNDRMRIISAAAFPTYLVLWDRLDDAYRKQGWEHREGRSFGEHEQSVAERGDRPGSLEQNLLWLREAGFSNVAAVHVVGIRAVIVATAPH
jgi:SAM-dependent methyltransferase